MDKLLLQFYVLVMGLVMLAPAAQAAGVDDVAVIVGNGDYQGTTPDVSYAHRDAEAMVRFLTDVRGFDPANIVVITDGSKLELEKAFGNDNSHKGLIWRYIHPKGGSRVFVYYSGHGVPGQSDKRGYLLPVDADPNDAEINGYPIDTLVGNLEKLPIQSATILLDACFSGESQGGTLVRSASGISVEPRMPEASTKVTVMSAARGNQLASWDETAQHGLFTEYFLQGVYGNADANSDGSVSVAEMKTYLDLRMTRAARRTFGRTQDVDVRGDTGLVLARFSSGTLPHRPKLSGIPVTTQPSKSTPIEVVLIIENKDGTYIAKEDASVRDEPLSTATRLARLDKDDVIHVNGKVKGKDWYRIDHEGEDAFVLSRSLKRISMREYEAWGDAEDEDTIKAYKAYLRNYSKGYFRKRAQKRVAQLRDERTDLNVRINKVFTKTIRPKIRTNNFPRRRPPPPPPRRPQW